MTGAGDDDDSLAAPPTEGEGTVSRLLAAYAETGRASVPPALPSTLGPYRLEEELGRGAMGRVYRARDTRLERDVAVKLLRASGPDTRARLLSEARAAAHLRHPNIVTIYSVEEHAGRDVLVMELAPGRSLRELLRAEGALAPGARRRLGVALVEAVAAAHTAGVVHRDLKPANVIVDGAGVPRVVDFGLARRGEAEVGAAGTPAYAAPEQLEAGAAVDARADVFALAVLLVELFTGRRPARGRASSGSGGQLDAAQRRALEREAAGLAEVLEGALSARPDARPPDAAALAEALARCSRPRLRTRVVRGLVGALGVSLLGLASLAVLWPGHASRDGRSGGPSGERPEPVLFDLAERAERMTQRGPDDPILQVAVSPSGRRVAWLDWSGRLRVGPWERPSSLREPDPLPLPRPAFAARFWGEERLLVVLTGPMGEGRGPLIACDLDGANQERLAERVEAVAGDASGRRFAYVDGEGVHVGRRAEQDILRERVSRTEAAARIIGPLRFAPEEDALAFVRMDPATERLRIVAQPLDGGDERTLVDVRTVPVTMRTSFAWTRRGLLYVRVSEPDAETESVLVRVSEGGVERELGRWQGALVSPEGADLAGRRLALLRTELGYETHRHRFDVEAPGPLGGGERIGFRTALRVSDIGPDGQLLATATWPEGWEAVSRALDGNGEPAPLLADPREAARTHPVALPGGGGVLFWQVRVDDDGRGHPRLMRWAGGPPRALLEVRAAPVAGTMPPPSWARVRCAQRAGAGCVLSRMEGGTLRFEGLDPETGETRPWLALEEVWHTTAMSWDLDADGERLAWVNVGEREPTIELREADGAVRAVPVDPPHLPLRLAWMPSGDALLVLSRRGDATRNELLWVPLDGRAPRSWSMPPGRSPAYLAVDASGRQLAVSGAVIDADAYRLVLP